MRSFLTAAFIVVSLFQLLAAPGRVDANSCRFVLGFGAIHDTIPDIVGDCVDNEAYGSDGAVQHTTRGLMAWRSVDNFTAFTDGYRTWVNGPYGIAERLNTERFPWERDKPVPSPASALAQSTLHPVSTASCLLGTADVTFQSFTKGFDGTVWAEGTVRNRCQVPASLTIDVLALEREDGPVVMAARTIFVEDLSPGQAQPIVARIAGLAAPAAFTWQVTMASEDRWCFDQASACISVNPWLASALLTLTSLEEGRRLVLVAAERGIRIARGTNERQVLARYSPGLKTITVDKMLDAYSSRVRAAILSHELQHVLDFAPGQPVSESQCYQGELDAFRQEARVWSMLWRDRLPPDVDAVHVELNKITLMASRDPAGLEAMVARRYSAQCGS